VPMPRSAVRSARTRAPSACKRWSGMTYSIFNVWELANPQNALFKADAFRGFGALGWKRRALEKNGRKSASRMASTAASSTAITKCAHEAAGQARRLLLSDAQSLQLNRDTSLEVSAISDDRPASTCPCGHENISSDGSTSFYEGPY
jgi:hypothetical protein